MALVTSVPRGGDPRRVWESWRAMLEHDWSLMARFSPISARGLSRLAQGVLLLAWLSCAAMAQEEAAQARYTEFLRSVAAAKSMKDLAPYFSREAWMTTYEQSDAMALAVMKGVYSDTEVVSAKKEGHKIRIDTASVGSGGKVVKAHAIMILEGGVWVIDQ